MPSVLDVVQVNHPDKGVEDIVQAYLVDTLRANEVPSFELCSPLSHSRVCTAHRALNALQQVRNMGFTFLGHTGIRKWQTPEK